MGASNSDIGLTVISNGEVAHYASVKGCGNLIWDMRLGLYGEVKPDPHAVLDFVAGSNWEDCVEKLSGPLHSPIYGTITLDFDLRRVVDDNGYDSSDKMKAEWLLRSIRAAMTGDSEAMCPSESLLDHLKHQRIRLVPLWAEKGDEAIVVFDGLEAAAGQIEPLRWDHFSRIDMPTGWVIFRDGLPNA
jgi:hypothetical protein